MSREERRNYERQMKKMERGPSLPPAAKARGERNAARRAARSGPARASGWTARAVLVAVIIAAAAGYVAFSFTFPTMPLAVYVGLIVGVLVLAAQVGLRVLRGRMARP